ncbi:DMT family transporter [Aliikangiella sp. IMCC44632]
MGAGEIYALASAVVWAFAVIMYTRIGDHMPAFELNLAKNSLGLVLVTLTALAFEWMQLPAMPAQDWFIIIFSGVIGIAIADTLYMKALNTIGAASTGIIAALYSPFVILLSIIYLNETLNLIQILGLLLVFGGVILVSLVKHFKVIPAALKFKGIGYGVLSVFLTALGVVIVKPVLEQQPFFWTTATRILAGVVAMIVYANIIGAWQKTIAEYKKPHNWFAIGIASFLGAYLAMSLWLAGYKYADASIAAILNETTSIFIVLLAWLILKEPLNAKKILGIILALSGVTLVVLN